MDLLGFGASDLASIAQDFREIVSVRSEHGLVFDAASVVVDEIRKNASYPVLLPDFAAPQLRTYPVYTVIAEKLHARAAGHDQHPAQRLSRSLGGRN